MVRQVNLNNEVEDALLSRAGILGDLLTLVEKLEVSDFDNAAAILAKTQISQSDLTQAQLDAMRWANEIKETAA